MKEEWRPVEGYEGYYEVSNLGNVRTVERIVVRHTKRGDVPVLWKSRIVKGWGRTGSWRSVWLTNKDGSQTSHTVHRLVAIAFLPNPAGKRLVSQKDGDRNNCRADNLEWVSVCGADADKISSKEPSILQKLRAAAAGRKSDSPFAPWRLQL